MKLLIASIITAFAFSSCNTTIGFARDMKTAGEGLEKVAQGKNSGGGDAGGAEYQPAY